MNDFLLYESKISLQFMETLRTIISIAKHDKKMKIMLSSNK
jgi:hypothetical protein